MPALKTLFIFLLTALAEIVGCYLPYLWLVQGKSIWLLVPAACSLALFAWLLTLHPTAAGRVYAAYGGVYICTAIFWLWAADGIKPSVWDVTGAAVALAGMSIITFAPKAAYRICLINLHSKANNAAVQQSHTAHPHLAYI